MILLLLLLALVPGLEAQTTAPDSLRGDTVPVVELPPLEVRLLRTPIPRSQAPLSISVLGARDLKLARAGTSLEEALQGLPGVQIQNRYNYSTGERIILRGQGARTQFGVRGLRVMVDEIPATLPDGQATLDHLDFLSMGRVEILRGPASALYGNGAGGVLRFTSLPPSTGGTEGEILLLAGSHGLRRSGAMASGEAAGTAYRVSAGFLDWDGFRTNPLAGEGSYGGVRRWNGHGTFRRDLLGGTLRMTMDLLDQDSENPGSLSRSLLEENPLQAFRYNVIQETGEEVEQQMAGAFWERSWSGLSLELGAHALRRDLWNPIPPAIIDLNRKSGGVQARVRGTGTRGDLTFHWILGGETEGQWDDRKNFSNQEGAPGALSLDQTERVLGTGAYVQGQLSLGTGIHLLGSLRADQVRFRARDRLVTTTNPDDSGSRTLSALSPSLGARIALTRSLSVRGSASTFFQTPTTSELANQPNGAGGMNPNLDPQRGRTLELGLEARPASGVQLEVVHFRTRVEDQLIPFQLPEAPGRSFFRNAGASEVDGLEVAAFGLLPGGFRLRGAYTYSDARFRDFVLEGSSLAGNRIPGLAAHRLEVLGFWDLPLPQRLPRGFLEARVVYQGEVFVDDPNSDTAAPFALLDLRGGLDGLTLAGRELSLFFGVNNLLDRAHSTAVSVNAFGGRFFEPGPGRSLYLGLRAILLSSTGRAGPHSWEGRDP